MLYLVRWVLCPPQPQARETAMMVSWPLSAMCSQTFLWTLRLASYSFTDMCSGSWKNASLLVSYVFLKIEQNISRNLPIHLLRRHICTFIFVWMTLICTVFEFIYRCCDVLEISLLKTLQSSLGVLQVCNI